METNIKQERSKNIIITILIIMIIGLAGLMCYDKFIVKKESEKPVSTETKKEEEIKKEVNRELTETEKQVLANQIDVLNTKFSKYYPLESVDNITNQELLNYGLTGLYGKDSFTTEEIEANIKKVFGNSITIKHENIICSIDKKSYYLYDKKSKTYSKSQEIHGHDGPGSLLGSKFYYVSTKIIDEKKIIIEAKVLYGPFCDGICSGGGIIYYTNYKDSENHANEIIKVEEENATLTTDLYKSVESKIPITSYQFEKDATGSYNLISVKVNK